MASKTSTPAAAAKGSRKSVQSAPVGDPASDDAAEQRFTIGELAQDLAVTTRAIRFYEQRGLVAPARKGSARVYGRRDRARLQLILRGKNLGFSLEEIGEYLSMYDGDPSQIAQTRHLLAKVDATITGLMSKRADIERALLELRDIRRQCLNHIKKQSD